MTFASSSKDGPYWRYLLSWVPRDMETGQDPIGPIFGPADTFFEALADVPWGQHWQMTIN